MGGRYLKRSVPQNSVWYASNRDPNSTVCCWASADVAVLDDVSGLSQCYHASACFLIARPPLPATFDMSSAWWRRPRWFPYHGCVIADPGAERLGDEFGA